MNIWNRFSEKNHAKYHPLDKKIIREFNNIRSKEQKKYLCHAPFKSMTFFHTGAVLACWYNKLFPLGHYPEDTINDIWFSKRAENLRNHICHNDLSYGCNDCRKNFNNRNFYTAGAWRYDFLPEKTSEYPVSMDFQISNSCNLQCIMCNGELSENIRRNRENQELYKSPYDEHFFEQVAPFIPFLKEASFSGGEPFFAPEFFKIWDLIIALNPKINISVTTNGNILNDKVKGYLEALPFNITVSLDAIKEETYKKIRVNGNFSLVLENINFFSEYAAKRGTVFSVKICPMRQNWHEMPELAQFLNERSISLLFNTVFFPPYCSLWNLESAKLADIAGTLKKQSLATGTDVQKQNAVRYGDLIRQIEFWQMESVKRESIRFEQKSIDELCDIFFTNVENYVTDELRYISEKCPVQVDEIKKLIKRMIADAPSEKIALEGMRHFASAPVERWLAELEVRDYEKNLDRFTQIASVEF